MRFPILGLLVVGGLLTSGFYFIDGLGSLKVGTWVLPLLISICAIFMLIGLASMKDY